MKGDPTKTNGESKNQQSADTSSIYSDSSGLSDSKPTVIQVSKIT